MGLKTLNDALRECHTKMNDLTVKNKENESNRNLDLSKLNRLEQKSLKNNVEIFEIPEKFRKFNSMCRCYPER